MVVTDLCSLVHKSHNLFCDVTLAEADAYLADNFYSAAWDAITTDDNKNKLLIMATRQLDYWIEWGGSKATEEQALRHPRYGLSDCDGYWIDSDIIHKDVKIATYELSNWFIEYDPSSEPDTKGFSEITVDVITLKIDKLDRDSTTTIPDVVSKIVACLGKPKSPGGGMVVDLGRA